MAKQKAPLRRLELGLVNLPVLAKRQEYPPETIFGRLVGEPGRPFIYIESEKTFYDLTGRRVKKTSNEWTDPMDYGIHPEPHYLQFLERFVAINPGVIVSSSNAIYHGLEAVKALSRIGEAMKEDLFRFRVIPE